MAHSFKSRRVEFLREIASAIGLDPDDNHITGITLESSVNDVAKVTVRMILDVSQDGKIAEVLKQYRLSEVPGPTTTSGESGPRPWAWMPVAGQPKD